MGDPSRAVYVADGVHLYEVERLDRNYGIAGGTIAAVRNALTDQRRDMDALEFALCCPIRSLELVTWTIT